MKVIAVTFFFTIYLILLTAVSLSILGQLEKLQTQINDISYKLQKCRYYQLKEQLQNLHE